MLSSVKSSEKAAKQNMQLDGEKKKKKWCRKVENAPRVIPVN